MALASRLAVSERRHEVRGVTEHERSPDEEVEVARAAIAARDFEHAVSHLAAAVVSDPTRTEWLALLDVVAESAPDPLSLLPPSGAEPMYVGHACVRAFLLARQGHYADALTLLVQVAEACPDRPFLDWGVTWLTEPGVVETVRVPAAVAFLKVCYERHVNADRAVPSLDGVLPIAERLRAAHQDEPDVLLLAASLLRRADRLEEGLAVAREAFDAQPSWATATAVALVHRAQGQVDEALEWYARGLEHDPEDLTARLDMADMLLDRWDLGRAIRLYEEVLRRQPAHPWAAPSAAAARVLLTGREKWKTHLQALCSGDPANERARQMAEGLARVPEAYVEEVPEPQEAMANVLRQVIAKQVEAGSRLKIKLSHLEAPSCVRAVHRELERRGVTLEITVEQVPTPDPRVAVPGATALLWRYEKTAPVALPPRPDRVVSEQVADLAATPYRLDAWKLRASAIAAELPDRGIASLLGVMAHPPATPDGISALDWVRHVQIAAALVLAHLDGGAARSSRRQGLTTLVEIARGPIDWTTEAAIVGLSVIVSREPASEELVRQVYQDLFDRIPGEGYCCYWRCLVRHCLKLPSVPDSERDQLEEWAIEHD
jgi:tetratricopeptide (TPR) repeat protein